MIAALADRQPPCSALRHRPAHEPGHDQGNDYDHVRAARHEADRPCSWNPRLTQAALRTVHLSQPLHPHRVPLVTREANETKTRFDAFGTSVAVRNQHEKR